MDTGTANYICAKCGIRISQYVMFSDGRILCHLCAYEPTPPQGWQCPKCVVIYAPSIFECKCSTYLNYCYNPTTSGGA